MTDKYMKMPPVRYMDNPNYKAYVINHLKDTVDILSTMPMNRSMEGTLDHLFKVLGDVCRMQVELKQMIAKEGSDYTVDRWSTVLLCVADAPSGIRFDEICLLSPGVRDSDVANILQDLEDGGIITLNSDHRYCITAGGGALFRPDPKVGSST